MLHDGRHQIAASHFTDVADVSLTPQTCESQFAQTCEHSIRGPLKQFARNTVTALPNFSFKPTRVGLELFSRISKVSKPNPRSLTPTLGLQPKTRTHEDP